MDYLWLLNWQWHLKDGYAYRSQRVGKTCYKVPMFRMIADAMYLSGLIDHIDRDRLNNQRSNLRAATYGQNRCNSKLNSNNLSGYRGVCWNADVRKWQAQLHHNGRKIYLGLFDDLKEAAKAYNLCASNIFGDFASLNDVTWIKN